MLKELKTHHRNIARLRFEGLKPAEIATRTETKLQTVYNILRDPMCKSYMNGLSDRADKSVINVREKLATMSEAALDTIADLIDRNNSETTPAAVRLGAAKDVLDRNGHKAPEKHEHIVGHFTTKDLLELQERAAKNASVDNLKCVNS
jgi:hypothetical protein